MDSPQQQPQPQQQILGHVQPQRLLKAKVQVVGRFLLHPEEDFGPEKADELVRRAAKDGTKVRTSLHLYTNGVRLGESGIFASMPLEFIKYQRIAACISPQQQQQQQQQQRQHQLSRLLTLCTRDYDQKCVTVLQFKDAAALAEASRLIDRQRRLVAEEADYLMMDVKPQRSSNASNWAMETAPQQQQQPHQRRPDSLSSSLIGFGQFDRRPAPFLVEPAGQSAASRLHHYQQQQQQVTYVTTSNGAGSLMQQQHHHHQVQQMQYSAPAVYHQQQQQQQMQLMKLVPVRQRQHHHYHHHQQQQQQPQLYAVHPSSAVGSSRSSLGRGLYLVTK